MEQITFWQCAQEDTKERAYKIKNWIKELLTYSVLFKRKIFGLIMIPAQDAIRKKKIGIINGNDFVQVLEKPTRILLGFSREWEMLRGLYNNNF
ncbi:hypothetical protein GLOIN_2v1791679 [Rhizophagus irregularis DAOM 181602=DAOM 197198]|nr:hypothetical protein GLOIN_2v1791679 [Rhizophagus irregularis DAOM 181602=DAOM 197198]